MKKNLITAVLMTIVTTVLLGIIYPLVVTALAQVMFHDKANGQLISHNGKLVGSRIIGQPFTSDAYFHSRPSYAGNGYDAANSSASNLGPTNHVLIDRVNATVAQLRAENPQNRFLSISLPAPAPDSIPTSRRRQRSFRFREWQRRAA